jgi:hypothetical protein
MQIKRLLLLLNLLSSLSGIILMLIGYSKVTISLEASDIYDTSTGSCCMIEKILSSIKKNWYYSESHYCIIASGLFIALCFTSGIGILMIELCLDKNKDKDKNVLSSTNPMYEI